MALPDQVMVSRFYDCGITDNLDVKNGYVARVDPATLKLADREETLDEIRNKAETHYLRVLQNEAFEKHRE